MMVNDEQRGETSNQEDNTDVNREMATTLKKLQSEMEALSSENESLRKEVATAKSQTKMTSKKTVPSVVRHLNMDEAKEWDQQETEERDAIITKKYGNAITNDKETEHNRDEYRDDEREECDTDREWRRSGHRRTKSRSYLLESVKKELQEVREMIQWVPGVPKPLEKATPTSYIDSPFADNIALVEIPKHFTVPHMKPYDGSNHPQEHIAQYQ